MLSKSTRNYWIKWPLILIKGKLSLFCFPSLTLHLRLRCKWFLENIKWSLANLFPVKSNTKKVFLISIKLYTDVRCPSVCPLACVMSAVNISLRTTTKLGASAGSSCTQLGIEVGRNRPKHTLTVQLKFGFS